MEPISAFGLAAGILQIVDYSSRLLSTGYQLYQDGSTVRHSEFTLVADDLSSLNDKIKAWARPDLSVSGPLAKDNQALENLTVEVTKIADELTIVLLRVRPKGEATIFESFRHAVMTMWKKAKIDETVQRLESIRGEIQFRILVSMMEKVNKEELLIDPALQSLGHATRTIVESILQNKSDIAAVVAAQTFESIQREDAREATANKRHAEVMAKIDHLPRAAESNILPQDILRTIKARLDFPRRMDRYDIIKAAEEKTFQWIFTDPSQTQASWANFDEWLRINTGVYWVSGKAGSGKSTLMKFIVQDARLRQALKLWAGKIPLIITSFYFWNPGESIQKSQEGLFRTILLEALKEMPALAQIIFPDRYEPGASWLEFPTFHQLRRAFIRLTTQSNIPIKIALIIDGLDEFEPTDASYTELVDIFLTATKSPNIKAILSSRPLSAFEALFAESPKLRLHELAKNDIEIFVKERLSRHPRLDELSQVNPEGAKSLVYEIVEAASGVFLWIKLVVDSLVEGFHNFDDLGDLRNRLRLIPRDLEDLFQRMLRQIPSEYKGQSSRMFQITNIRYAAPKYAQPDITAMDLYYADISLEKIVESPIAHMPVLDRNRREKEIEGKLRSRCAGLVELHYYKNASSHAEVQFLHRSVADWLQKQHIWDHILEGTKDTNFYPYVSLLQSRVMRIKTAPPVLQNPSEWRNIEQCLFFAQIAEQSTGQAQKIILDEMERVMSIHDNTVRTSGGNVHPWDGFSNVARGEASDDFFITFSIQYGLHRYVQAKIDAANGKLPERRGRPFLYYACMLSTQVEYISGHVDMVRVLLKHGADPNEDFNDITPWRTFLLELFRRARSPHWLSMAELLVQHGADVNAYIDIFSNSHWHRRSALVVIKEKAYRTMNRNTENSDLRECILRLVELLEQKGAKTIDYYWRDEPQILPQVYPPSKEPTETKHSKQKPTRRARRYLARLFKSTS